MGVVRFGVFYVGLVGLFFSQAGIAADTIPTCPAYRLREENRGDPGNLPVNNAEVLAWRRQAERQPQNCAPSRPDYCNNFHARGHVLGPIVKIYPDHSGHEHFAIQIGPREDDTVEIVYNQAFGAVPEPKIGMQVEACGDYITSVAPTPGPGGKTYPASPDHSLVHWVHLAPQRSGHHSGYLVINGVLTGQEEEVAKPRPPRPGRRENGNTPRVDLNAR